MVTLRYSDIIKPSDTVTIYCENCETAIWTHLSGRLLTSAPDAARICCNPPDGDAFLPQPLHGVVQVSKVSCTYLLSHTAIAHANFVQLVPVLVICTYHYPVELS